MTCFEINRSFSSPGKEGDQASEEQMLAELTQEKMLPDPKSYCPTPSRKGMKNQAQVRMMALWARRVTGAR